MAVLLEFCAGSLAAAAGQGPTLGFRIHEWEGFIKELPDADVCCGVKAGSCLLRDVYFAPVGVGREASVRLAALNQRTTPVVSSHVLFVSADRLTDRQTQQSYYRVRLSLDREKLTPQDRALLAPGMPAKAFIATSERTMMQYLFRPIEDSFAKALWEE